MLRTFHKFRPKITLNSIFITPIKNFTDKTSVGDTKDSFKSKESVEEKLFVSKEESKHFH